VFDQGIFVYGDALNYWRPGRAVWNQSAYSVSNVNDDGTIPAHPLNSWQTPGGANTFRAQITPPGLDPFAAPDLTASRMVVDNSSCPVSANVTIRAGNGGSMHVLPGVNVALRDGGNLVGVISTTHTLQPGQYHDLTFHWASPASGSRAISVTVDDDGTGKGAIPESRKDNNTHTRAVNVCTGANQPPLILSTPPLTAVVGLLYTYSVQASDPNNLALNYGLDIAPAVAVINSSGGLIVWKPVAPHLGPQPFTLSVDNGNGGITRQVFTVTVISQQALPGPVAVCTLPGSPGIIGNGIGQDCIPATTLNAGPGAVTPTIATDQRSYTAHDLARLISTIKHAGGVNTYAGLTATVTVRNGGNTQVFSSIHALNPLPPGGQINLADTFDTSAQAPGNFTAQIVVTSGSGQVASGSTTFTVTDAMVHHGVALSGTLAVTPAVIGLGKSYSVTWSATNTGNSTLSSVGLQLLEVDPGNGNVPASDLVTVPLAVGASIGHISILTGANQNGPLLVVLLGSTKGGQSFTGDSSAPLRSGCLPWAIIRGLVTRHCILTTISGKHSERRPAVISRDNKTTTWPAGVKECGHQSTPVTSRAIAKSEDERRRLVANGVRIHRLRSANYGHDFTSGSYALLCSGAILSELFI
jgi:CARDB